MKLEILLNLFAVAAYERNLVKKVWLYNITRSSNLPRGYSTFIEGD